MNIVVLDGYTLNPGDLCWDELKKLGNCQIFDRTESDDIVNRAIDAEIVLTNKTPLTKEILINLPNLKYIGVLATGYNVVDVAAAAERNIPVTNIPIYGTQSVAQLVFALLLELAHHVGHHSQTAKAGKWKNSIDFCYWDYPLIELAGLTIGLVGFGRIGQATGKLAHAFDMNIIAHDIYAPQDLPDWAEMTDLDTLFEKSDVISLHCPLTKENEQLIHMSNIQKMKKSAFLINTSRGPLINEDDLAKALENDLIAGAAVDVLSSEPPQSNNPLLKSKNCIITPHIAWATKAARERLMHTAVENVKQFLAGDLQNSVNM